MGQDENQKKIRRKIGGGVSGLGPSELTWRQNMETTISRVFIAHRSFFRTYENVLITFKSKMFRLNESFELRNVVIECIQKYKP